MNKRLILKQAQVFAIGLMLLGGFQNCSEQEFSSIIPPVTATGGPNCREQLNSITTPIQLVFVVDVSGSNVGNNGTDIDKKMRAGSISKFFSTYKTKSNFAWNMITFQKTAATTRLENGFASEMEQMIDDFMAITDTGATPYAKALEETQGLIAGQSSRPLYTKYVVVFMSDGKPNPDITDADLKAKVLAVTGEVPGEVSLNTLYYGPKDDEASGRLRTMAQDGGGNFLDTNANPTGNSFLISDLVIVPGVICDPPTATN